jgi:1,4-alpha-glucan branching enzyme
MGQEFGQLREWSEERELDWFLLKEPLHEDLKNYFRDLLHLYRKYPALYSKDYDWTGFEWINCDDADRSIFSFIRKGYSGRNNLLFVCNFTPVERPDYRVGVPKKGKYTLLLDHKRGLLEKKEQVVFTPAKKECDGRDYSFSYPLPAYGAAVFKF